LKIWAPSAILDLTGSKFHNFAALGSRSVSAYQMSTQLM